MRIETEANSNVLPLAPEFPGVNMQMGLKRVNGDEALLLRLLDRFASEHAEDLTKLRIELSQQHYPESARILHTLKGLTGSIGIESLYHAIDSSEQPPSAEKLDELDLLLTIVVDGIRKSIQN